MVGVALVSGSSRGLGAVIARKLGEDFPVAVVYRSGTEAAERVAQDIREAGGIAETFRADVTDEEAVAGLARAVHDWLGPVQVLVTSATGPQASAAIEDLTWETHLGYLEYFVKSPTLLLQAFLGDLREFGRGGRVVQIGSDAFERATPRSSAYTAAKGAQWGLTRSWARELGPSGVTVNLVAPGWIPVERHAGTPEEDLERYRANVPLGHFGTPQDIAAAVAYLASPAGGFVTGERLTVNGGHTID